MNCNIYSRFINTFNIQVIKDFYHRTPSIWIEVFRAYCHRWKSNIFDGNNQCNWFYWVCKPCCREKYFFLIFSRYAYINIIWSFFSILASSNVAVSVKILLTQAMALLAIRTPNGFGFIHFKFQVACSGFVLVPHPFYWSALEFWKIKLDELDFFV